MELRTRLEQRHSKENISQIVNYLLQHPGRVPDLLAIFLGKEPLLVQRSAWVVGDLGRARPELLVSHHAAMLAACRRPLHPAVLRNVIRYFAEVPDLPEALHGELADICFPPIADPKAPAAIRVFAMEVMLRLTRIYPELRGELKEVIETEIPRASAGFRSRGRKVLSALDQLST